MKICTHMHPVACAAVLLVALAAAPSAVRAMPSYLPVIEQAPAFNLIDTDRRPVSSRVLDGKVTLLAFMYTHCASVCPLVTERMAVIAQRLKQAGLLGTQAELVSITFDPKRDTPGWLAKYAKSHGAESPSWRFLSGSQSQIDALLRSYDFHVARGRTGDFDHVSRIYLIDSAGRIRQIYSLGFLDAETVLRDVGSLLDEQPADTKRVGAQAQTERQARSQ